MSERKEKDVDFTKPWTYSDVIFKIEDQQIHASKAVLGLASPVFNAMFTAGGFVEKTATEIPLPGKEVTSFLEFMKLLHFRHRKITIDNVYQLLPLTDEYQIKHFTERCEEVLLSMMEDYPCHPYEYPFPVESGIDYDVIYHLFLADTYHLSELRAQCIREASDMSLSNLDKSPYYPSIEPTTLNEVFRGMISKQDEENGWY